MANNSDLKRWYKKTKVEKNDFVRHDLFEHDIRITGTNIDVVFTVYSSKNLKADSLQDLKTLCGDTFVKSCTGKVNNVAAYAITQLKILCIDGTEALLSGVTIEDTLTTI